MDPGARLKREFAAESKGVNLVGLSKAYGDVEAVRDVSIDVAPGEIYALLGPSGAGKSTLLMMLTGLLQPDQGKVVLNGTDVTSLPPEKRNVGTVFQSYALFPHMTVYDNVAFGLKRRHVSRSDIRSRVQDFLDAVGLGGMAKRRPAQLSGGERQRVAFIRALIIQPALLALDEPFGSLDVQLREGLRKLTRRLVKETAVPAIAITHDQDDVFGMADRVGVIHNGRMVQQGSILELYERPRTAFVARFLGNANVFDSALIGHAQRGSESLMVRPEHLAMTDVDNGRVQGVITDVRFTKNAELLRYQIAVGELEFQVLTLRREPELVPGARVGLDWRPEHLVELESEDGVAEDVDAQAREAS